MWCSRSREHTSACQASIPCRTAFHPVRDTRTAFAGWVVNLVSAMVMLIKVRRSCTVLHCHGSGARIYAVQLKTNCHPIVRQFRDGILHSGEPATTVSLCYGLSGRLVQLARTLPSHGRGHRFESCNAHQIPAAFCLLVCRRPRRYVFFRHRCRGRFRQWKKVDERLPRLRCRQAFYRILWRAGIVRNMWKIKLPGFAAVLLSQVSETRLSYQSCS